MRPVVIVNDLLGGWMGERTFWNYMLEGIPGIRGLDHLIMDCSLEVSDEARKHIHRMPSDTIIIQNATFIDKVSNQNFTVAFLQDNLRATGKRYGGQERVLRTSQIVVANSHETAKAYAEFNPRVIPIGIDTNLFYPARNKKELREQHGIPTDRSIGVFVGDFTATKGWGEVKALIDCYPEIFFILVSKREESYEAANTTCFNKVNQDKLAQLYNCADFFVLGSPVETQCLAALEVGFCGIPIVMKRTGIFMDFTEDQRNSIGIFDGNLAAGFQEFLKDPKRFSPRETLLSLDLGIDSMIYKWRALLESI